MINLPSTLHFAEQLALKLGKHIQASRHRAKVTVQKDLVDICTNIDQEVEQMAIEAIGKQFPEHNIHSEEIGFIDKKSEYTWYLDPIDGTKEFVRGLPFYRTTLTLELPKQILLAVAYYPVFNELVTATNKSPAKKNGTILKVNSTEKLEKAYIYSYLPNKKYPPDDYHQSWVCLEAITLAAYRLIGSSECLHYLKLVAEGAAEAYVCFRCDIANEWHDIAPGLLIAQQAGAKITDMYGQPLEGRNLEKGLIVSNGKIHDQLIEVIRKNRK